jgi:hypothetical protein
MNTQAKIQIGEERRCERASPLSHSKTRTRSGNTASSQGEKAHPDGKPTEKSKSISKALIAQNAGEDKKKTNKQRQNAWEF